MTKLLIPKHATLISKHPVLLLIMKISVDSYVCIIYSNSISKKKYIDAEISISLLNCRNWHWEKSETFKLSRYRNIQNILLMC